MLHYEIRGDHTNGRPLILLHGFLESSTMWESLRFDGPTIRIDLPGHGMSKGILSSSIHSMAELVLQVLQNEHISECDVIGHSMGGYVALELAERKQDIQKLILLNSNVWADSAEKQEDRRRVAQLVETKKELFINEAIPNLFLHPESFHDETEALITEALGMSSEAIALASIAMSERRSFEHSVLDGAVAVYLIQGENDPISSAERMREIMQNQLERMFVVPSGHMSHFEAKKQVEDLIQKIRH